VSAKCPSCESEVFTTAYIQDNLVHAVCCKCKKKVVLVIAERYDVETIGNMKVTKLRLEELDVEVL
jgi:hypothetical protein